MRTALVRLRFILRIKVTLATPHGTYETVELEERELRIIASNESQRRLAMSKYREAVDRVRARDTSRLPSPPPSPSGGPSTSMASSSLHGKGSPKGKSVRRPHTSAGPRDSTREVGRAALRRGAPNVRELRPRASRGLSSQGSVESSTEGETEEIPVNAWKDELEHIEVEGGWQRVEAPRMSPTALSAPAFKPSFAGSSRGSILPPSSSITSSKRHAPPPPPAPPESVRAWEEELERIAVQSRRQSVQMLWFNSERRTRPRIDPQVPH